MSEAGRDSRERIMDATYRALIEGGYADLTMSDIAAESETSTALLHYHFDTKEDLLVAFLEHLLGNIEAELEEMAAADPVERLFRVIEWYVLGASEADRQAFHVALLELRSQAPYNERYRERLQRADRLLRDALADIVREGIETGAFTETDPELAATLILSAVDGARTRQLTIGDPDYAAEVREGLYQHVLAGLFNPDAIDRWETLRDEAADR